MEFPTKNDYNSDSSIKLESDDPTDVCRTCLCRGLKMNSLFDTKVLNICERIQFCTGLKFLMADPLPSNICNTCLDNLTVAYNFKSKCLKTDRKLWTYYSKPDLLNVNSVYIRENQENYYNDLDLRDEELIIHENNVKGDDIMDGDYVDDIYSSKEKQNNILPLVKVPEKVISNEVELETNNVSSLRDTVKSQKCINDKSIHKLKFVKRTKFRRLFCESCNMRFENKQDSDKHKNTVHKDEAWVCQHCGKTSTKKSAYYYHMTSHFRNDTSGLDGKADGRPSASGRKRLGVKRGPYKKKTGDIGVPDFEGSAIDIPAKRSRRKFKLNKQFCEKCDVRFENDQEFIAHKRDVHKHVYLCEICGRVFYNRDARFSHMTSHERPKFACDHCDYSTTRKQDLIKHLYVHNGVKSYQCEYCPLSFYTGSNLQHHLRRHRDGPHECQLCGKRILDRYSFKRHMDTHSGSAAPIQFTCQLCGSCFRRSSRLNQHMLKRHNVRTPPQRPGRRRLESSDIL